MNEVINLLKSHRSIRKYLNKPVSNEAFEAIITSAQAASTSSFMQAYTIIRIDDKEERSLLAKLSGEQPYIEECPLFLVFCADLNKLDLACQMNNSSMEKGYTESFIIATVDTALAAQNALVAAESLGLGGVYIGGIRNNPREVSKLLSLPKNTYPLFGMCLGYPDENPDIKLRLPSNVACSIDKYDVNKKIDLIKSYDKSISDYYIKRTDGVRNDTWTGQMAKLVSRPARPHMRDFLDEQGFIKK